jgi:murein DD-endopeptidase MepM/ murein hydrolase activator NlpD
MSRSLPNLVRVCAIAFAAVPSLTTPCSAAGGTAGAQAVAIEEPFRLFLRDQQWTGDPHAMPAGRAVLENADRHVIWQIPDVTVATASADGSTVALLTGDYRVLVAKLPEAPRALEGHYLIPRLSRDGSRLVAQRLGSGGHILNRTQNAKGIALVDVASGEGRLVLQGNDLYLPSFADDDRVFYGSGGEEQFAGVYLLDLRQMRVARVTQREGFPSEVRLAGGTVVFEIDGETFRRPVPAPADFVPVHRFDGPRLTDIDLEDDARSPDFGSVRIRRPTTKVPIAPRPKIWNYFDNTGDDYMCGGETYNGHEGTDLVQDLGDAVVAPASGHVFMRYDGCANSGSPGCGMGWGNHIALKHSDKTVSLESHGKKGTVAPFGFYACGDKIMETAASGNANAPAYHDHHETWVSPQGFNDKSLRYDPFQGPCDASDPSKWSSQGPYLGVPGTACTN